MKRQVNQNQTVNLLALTQCDLRQFQSAVVLEIDRNIHKKKFVAYFGILSDKNKICTEHRF